MKTSSTCHILKCSVMSWVSAFSSRHVRGNWGHIQSGVPKTPKQAPDCTEFGASGDTTKQPKVIKRK